MKHGQGTPKTAGKVRLISGLAKFLKDLSLTAISLILASLIAAAMMMPLGPQGWIVILSLMIFSASYLILSHYFEESLTIFFEKIFGNIPSVPETTQKRER
ncbi:MAG: hypothetical protein HGA31_01150 [Candidatus Moranbacteria bacterium]|nr:hypothetical protein [Candidatus Moranbacteria bacterium]